MNHESCDSIRSLPIEIVVRKIPFLITSYSDLLYLLLYLLYLSQIFQRTPAQGRKKSRSLKRDCKGRKTFYSCKTFFDIFSATHTTHNTDTDIPRELEVGEYQRDNGYFIGWFSHMKQCVKHSVSASCISRAIVRTPVRRDGAERGKEF